MLGVPITEPAFTKLSSPAFVQSVELKFKNCDNFAAVAGKNGCKTMLKLAVICNAIFIIVFTLSTSVLTNFHGSVSAKYLFPSRAKFIASACASLNL